MKTELEKNYWLLLQKCNRILPWCCRDFFGDGDPGKVEKSDADNGQGEGEGKERFVAELCKAVQCVLENTSRILPERAIHLDEIEGDKEDAHGNESEDSLPPDNLQRRRLETKMTTLSQQSKIRKSKTIS